MGKDELRSIHKVVARIAAQMSLAIAKGVANSSDIDDWRRELVGVLDLLHADTVRMCGPGSKD